VAVGMAVFVTVVMAMDTTVLVIGV